MKRTQVIATIALAFMLGVFAPIANSVTTDVYASDAGEGAGVTPSCTASNEDIEIIQNEEDLLTAMAEPGRVVICVGGEIQLTKTLKITDNKSFAFLEGGALVADGSFVPVQVTGGHVFFDGGELRVNGNQNAIELFGTNNPEAAKDTVSVIINGTKIATRNMYGVAIYNHNGSQSGNCYGASLYFNGTIEAGYGIYVNGMIDGSHGVPYIKIGDNAKILTAAASAEDATPIYAAGPAEWEIGAAELTGKAAVAMKSGKLTFKGTKIIVNGADVDDPELNNNGIYGTGSVFQIEHNDKYTGNVEIYINGGTYKSEHSRIFQEYKETDVAKIEITGGTFTGADVNNTEFVQKYVKAGTETRFDEETKTLYVGEDDEEEPGDDDEEGENNNGGGTGSGTNGKDDAEGSDTTQKPIVSEDGLVSITGNFPVGTQVEIAESEREVPEFSDKKHALFDIELVDADGKEIEFNGKATVAIKVPSNINGAKSNIYYVSEDGILAKLASEYSATARTLTFETTHFSLYAIVEDGGVDLSTPDTGALGQKIAEAVTTVLPAMVLGGGLFALYIRRLMNRRKAEAKVVAESEINADAAQIIAEAEQNERFTAQPMTKADRDEIRERIFGGKR